MLAQSEIDALLSGAIDMDQKNGGDRLNLAGMMGQPGEHTKMETDGKKNIQAYNFWSPARFSKEQIRAGERFLPYYRILHHQGFPSFD